MAEKDGRNELKITLPDSDIQGLRQMAKANEHPDGESGLAAEFIEQGLGKRKLGDYIHLEAHQTAIDGKDTTIAGLKKKAVEAAEMWAGVVISLGMQDDLREKIKDIPAWCLERVAFITEALNTAIEKNEEYEKQIAELKETTILRTDHEQRVDAVAQEKAAVETQLKAETESVKRLNVKLSGQESEIQQLKTDLNEQEHTIGSLRDELEQSRSDVRTWQALFAEANQKSWWRKLLATIRREAILIPVIDHETEPQEDKDAPEQHAS